MFLAKIVLETNVRVTKLAVHLDYHADIGWDSILLFKQ